MSKNYPDTNPYEHNKELASAYADGWNHGHGIACHNVPKLGANLWLEDMGRVTVDAENIREIHQSLCHAAESNSRQYSPFEFTAHEFNKNGEGGFRIDYGNGEESDEIYSTEEEARAAAESEGYDDIAINEYQDSESLWAAFDQGISDSISADLSEYTDEDYGIEEEEESADEEEEGGE